MENRIHIKANKGFYYYPLVRTNDFAMRPFRKSYFEGKKMDSVHLKSKYLYATTYGKEKIT